MRSATEAPPPEARDDPAAYEILGFGLQLILTPVVSWICIAGLGLGWWAALPPSALLLTILRGRGAVRRASWYTCAWSATSLGIVLLFVLLSAVFRSTECLYGALLVVVGQPYVFLALAAFLVLVALVAPLLDREEAEEAARRTAARRARSASSAPPGA